MLQTWQKTIFQVSIASNRQRIIFVVQDIDLFFLLRLAFSSIPQQDRRCSDLCKVIDFSMRPARLKIENRIKKDALFGVVKKTKRFSS